MENGLECPHCGEEVFKVAAPSEDDEEVCTSCGWVLRIMLDDYGDAYLAKVSCKHGRDADDGCASCEEEEG